MSELRGAPPHDIEAERSVIGTVLVFGPDAMANSASLRVDDFFDPTHREAWAGMLELEKRGVAIGPISLADELKTRGVAGRFQPSAHQWLMECANVATVAEILPHHVAIVREKATLRGLLALAVEMQAQAYSGQSAEEVLRSAGEALAKLEVMDDSDGPERVGDVLSGALEVIETRARTQKDPLAIETGISTLDSITGGAKPEQLILIAGRPGDGKTSLADNIAFHGATVLEDPCLFFSEEMGRQEVLERILGLGAKVDVNRMGNGKIEWGEWRKVMTAAGQIAKGPLFLDCRPHPIAQLCAHARRWHAKEVRGKGKTRCAIFIDYAQLLEVEASFAAKTDEQRIAIVSRLSKRLAKTLHCPVYLVSQLNRKVTDRGGPPVMADLRGSGSLEQDADIILFVYRDIPMDKTDERNKSGPAQIIVGKHRGGPTGIAHTNWIREYMAFTAASEQGDEEAERAPDTRVSGGNWQDGRDQDP